MAEIYSLYAVLQQTLGDNSFEFIVNGEAFLVTTQNMVCKGKLISNSQGTIIQLKEKAFQRSAVAKIRTLAC
jgi:hypothetical protein